MIYFQKVGYPEVSYPDCWVLADFLLQRGASQWSCQEVNVKLQKKDKNTFIVATLENLLFECTAPGLRLAFASK